MDFFTREYTLVNSEMMSDYRIKPTSIAMYFEDCVATFLTTKNLAAFDLIKKNLIWIISEYQISIVGPLPFWSEKFQVEVWASEISSLRLYMEFRLKFRGIVFAQGDSTWAILDATTRYPMPIQSIVTNISPIAEYINPTHKHRVEKPLGEPHLSNHMTNVSDVDFNRHINNRTYVNSFAKSLPELFVNKDCTSAIVKFKQESFLGDVLTCRTYRTAIEDVLTASIVNDKGVEVCQLTASFGPNQLQKTIADYDLEIRNGDFSSR